MPGIDGTGPMGQEAMTGRGFWRNFLTKQTVSLSRKELLVEQKELLQARLSIISKQLERLSDVDK